MCINNIKYSALGHEIKLVLIQIKRIKKLKNETKTTLAYVLVAK